MLRSLDVASLPLIVLADVQEVVVGSHFAEVGRVHRCSFCAIIASIDQPYPVDIVPLIPEFLGRRRLGFTYPLRVMEELGIDRPTFGFVISGVGFQGDEGGRLEDLFNPYSTIFDQWKGPAAAARGAGLAELDEASGRWRITPKGRDLFTRVRREADAYLATLEPIPSAEIVQLAALLARALAAVEASGVPFDHMPRNARLRGNGQIPMVALENALFGLWHARDDSHMSSWRDAGFDGPSFDVLTRLWRKEATTESDLVAKLPTQRPEDVAAGLARLRAKGLVEPEALEVTEKGAKLRQHIEDETDRKFFAPWPADVGKQAPWMIDRLRSVNAALAPRT